MDWLEKARLWIEAEADIEQAHLPVAVELFNRDGLLAGQKVLDIGCGSGGTVLSAASLVGPKGTVTGIDISPLMAQRTLERAAPSQNVTTLAGDAQSYAFEPKAFDLVISLFGMMFYQDPARAFSNIQTAVRPSGRMLFATWAGGKDNPWFSLPKQAAELHIGDLPTPSPTAPGPLAFANVDRVIGLLKETGWENAEVEEVDLHLTPIGTPARIANWLFKIGPFDTLIQERTASAAEAATMSNACKAELAQGLSNYVGGGAVRVPAKVRFFSAQRPS